MDDNLDAIDDIPPAPEMSQEQMDRWREFVFAPPDTEAHLEACRELGRRWGEEIRRKQDEIVMRILTEGA
jgi:hypothetical protein